MPGSPISIVIISKKDAPVAQLDRVNASEALGHKFESCRAHHYFRLTSAHKFPAVVDCRAHHASKPRSGFASPTSNHQGDVRE